MPAVDKPRQIMSGDDYDLDGMAAALVVVKLAQLFSEAIELHSHDGIGSRIECMGLVENIDGNRIFLYAFRISFKVFLTDVFEQAGEPGILPERPQSTNAA